MTHELVKGFEKFRHQNYDGDHALMRELVEHGQSPDYFIISCIDSRSSPATIFNTKPGSFFGHKAMGAIVRPYTKGTALSAAFQFALKYNDVKEIIILGHTGCGAIKALVEKLDDEEISSFVDVAQEGVRKAEACCAGICSHDMLLRQAEEQIILLSARNAESYPAVRKALDEGRIVIRPWLFDMKNGALLEYSSSEQEFTPI